MKIVKLEPIRFIIGVIIVFLMRYFISKDTITLSLIFAVVFCVGLYILLRFYNHIIINKTKT